MKSNDHFHVSNEWYLIVEIVHMKVVISHLWLNIVALIHRILYKTDIGNNLIDIITKENKGNIKLFFD
jgi:hypothetical protein